MASIFLVAAALAVDGCGGGSDSNGGGSDPDAAAVDEINAALERVFTTSDPLQCSEDVTLKGLEQFSPGTTEEKDPIAACEKAIDPNAEAESIEISDVAVDGTEATAKMTPEGGSLAGSEVVLALVEDDGWRIDQVESVDIYDRDEYVSSLDESAAIDILGETQLPPEDARCVVAYVNNEASTAALERFVTEGDLGYAFDAIRTCVGGGTNLLAITFLTRQQLLDAGLDKRQADCVAGAGIAELGDVTLEELAESQKLQDRYAAGLESAALACS